MEEIYPQGLRIDDEKNSSKHNRLFRRCGEMGYWVTARVGEPGLGLNLNSYSCPI